METYAIHMLVRVFYYFFQLIIHTNETLGIRTWQHNQAILTLYNRKHCCYTIFRNESQKKVEACDVSAFVIADDLFVVDEHFELN